MNWCPQKRLKIIRVKYLKEFTIEEIQHKTGPLLDKEKMGWHLSYFGGVDMVRKKLSEFSHSSMKSVRECIDNPELIRQRIENNEDILGRNWEKLVVMEPEKVPKRMDLIILYQLDAIYQAVDTIAYDMSWENFDTNEMHNLEKFYNDH